MLATSKAQCPCRTAWILNYFLEEIAKLAKEDDERKTTRNVESYATPALAIYMQKTFRLPHPQQPAPGVNHIQIKI
jgi:hypothetical protein